MGRYTFRFPGPLVLVGVKVLVGDGVNVGDGVSVGVGVKVAVGVGDGVGGGASGWMRARRWNAWSATHATPPFASIP